MRKTLNKISLLIFSLSIFSSVALPQTSPTDDTQIWNDVQLIYHLNKKTDVFLTGTFRLGRNITHPIDERIGSGINFKPSKYISISPSYLYIAQQPLKNIKRYENRVNLTTTLTIPFGKNIITDRNQFERRFLNNRPDTWRYRNRLQIEHSFTKRKFKFSLYANDEVFYDSGATAWTRNRFLVGFIHKFSEHYSIDIYGGRQNDGRVKPGNWNILGTILRVQLN